MAPAPDPIEALRNVNVAPRLIEEEKPLPESLEWKLSELYWNTTGTRGFVQSEIPYTITSGGALSLNAARLFYANCCEHPAERLEAIEIGAGTGLFARLFLDEFARICEQRGASFDKRLTYYVTDRSSRSLEHWRELKLFEGTPAVIARSDAHNPMVIETSHGEQRLSGLRAVFCNYSLDSLPSTVLRKGESGPEELCVRTDLTNDSARLSQHTHLTLAYMRELAREPKPELIPLVSLLEFEAGFYPCQRQYPYAQEALTFGHNWPRVILNHGAIECLESLKTALDPAGFILINDYGLVSAEDAAKMSASQRFGPTAALGLNFPFLEHHLSTNGTSIARPESDEKLPIHPRLLTRGPCPETQGAFHEIFDWAGHRRQHEPVEQARRYIEAGRLEAAKKSYELALSERSRDWTLLGEIAEFLIRQVGNYESGLDVATAALAINPWYSVWLWNVYGDALYALDRFTDAHDAYRKAEEMEPGDVRTCLNLAYSHAQLGDLSSALEALARGLANDRGGIFRERLLEKQHHILSLIQAGFVAEQEWLARRSARLLNC
jgi:hypothetical protein